MVPHVIGCAELSGRLRTVIHHHGARTRTALGGSPSDFVFTADGQTVGLRGYVLHDLGVTADTLGADRLAALNAAPGDQIYAAASVVLTAKAARLAVFSAEFEESGTWAEAVDLAARLAHQVADTCDDRRIGPTALLGVLRHVADTHPYPTLPGWSPEDTPLFLDGYPTTLLDHAAADLHVDAVASTRVGETWAVALFSALDWRLTLHAEAIADAAQHLEARGECWPDAVTLAEAADLRPLRLSHRHAMGTDDTSHTRTDSPHEKVRRAANMTDHNHSHNERPTSDVLGYRLIDETTLSFLWFQAAGIALHYFGVGTIQPASDAERLNCVYRLGKLWRQHADVLSAEAILVMDFLISAANDLADVSEHEDRN